MPLPPKQREKKKKVVAVSASKVNDPLAGKRKTTKAEFAAIQAENAKAEREKKEKWCVRSAGGEETRRTHCAATRCGSMREGTRTGTSLTGAAYALCATA